MATTYTITATCAGETATETITLGREASVVVSADSPIEAMIHAGADPNTVTMQLPAGLPSPPATIDVTGPNGYTGELSGGASDVLSFSYCNEVPNAWFTENIDGWQGVSAERTVEWDGTVGHDTPGSMLVANMPGGTGTGLDAWTGGGVAAAEVSQSWSASAWIRHDDVESKDFRIRIHFYDSAGSETRVNGTTIAIEPGVWTKVTAQAASEIEDITSVGLYIIGYTGSEITDASAYHVDDVILSQTACLDSIPDGEPVPGAGDYTFTDPRTGESDTVTLPHASDEGAQLGGVRVGYWLRAEADEANPFDVGYHADGLDPAADPTDGSLTPGEAMQWRGLDGQSYTLTLTAGSTGAETVVAVAAGDPAQTVTVPEIEAA